MNVLDYIHSNISSKHGTYADEYLLGKKLYISQGNAVFKNKCSMHINYNLINFLHYNSLDCHCTCEFISYNNTTQDKVSATRCVQCLSHIN